MKILIKFKKKLANLYCGLKKWIFRPGRGILKVLAIVIAAILVAAIVVGICLGCAGSLIALVVGLPALLFMLAFNCIVPSCGGPALTFKMSIGIIILAGIAINFLQALKK